MSDSFGPEIRPLGPADTRALIACIRRCYGDTYPHLELYGEDWIRASLESGRLSSTVAAWPDGRIVGHIGSLREARDEPVVDTIAGIVDPAHRRQGLVPKIGAAMLAADRARGIRGARHTATAAHDRTQKLIASAGGIATGVLLAQLPSTTDYRGLDHGFGRARIAVVTYYQSWAPLPPLTVYPGPRDEAIVSTLYEALGHDRRVLPVHGPGHEARLTARSSFDPRTGVTHLRFTPAADDRGPATMESAIDASLNGSAEVVHADVPLADPGAPSAIAALRARGFIFGALLPGSPRSEILRLQFVGRAKLALDAIVTASEQGAGMLHHVRSELEGTRRS